jgi:hypothetical protein
MIPDSLSNSAAITTPELTLVRYDPMADRMDADPVMTAAAEPPHNGSRKRSLVEATTLPLSQQAEETGRRETEENNDGDDDDDDEGAASPVYQRMTFYGEHRRYVTASTMLS